MKLSSPSIRLNIVLLFFGLLLNAMACEWAIAQEPRPPQVVADFEDAAALKLTGNQAEGKVVQVEGNGMLQITTEQGAQWPGVTLVPPAGKWDLEGYDLVQLEVRNPEEVPLRVLLSLNNPGADGRNHVNTEAVDVPAGSKATLTVPFGSWHGETNHPLDRANVVSMQVFLERPKQAQRFLVDNIRAAVYDRKVFERVQADPFFQQLQPVFGRGINLGNALEAPNEGEWGVTLKESYFEAIASAGLQSVRIPVRWSAHAAAEAPYTIEPAFFARVDWAVQQALSRRLRPVVNVHHYGELMQRPDEHRERFLALWKQIAEHYREYPTALAFELLNEPQDQLDAGKWNELLAATLPVVRASNPTREIVVGPAHFNSIDQLQHLKLPEDDRRLIVTFHYYSPFQFTHQGAHWLGDDAQKWVGTKWTGTPAEKQAIEREFDRAIAWAVEHKRPIYLGEFGAFERADLDSRARWTRFVAEEAVKRKMGFAYWEFCSGFGAYNAKQGQWIEPLRDALLAKP